MSFKIGEIAIFVRPGSPHFGKEVEILSGPQLFPRVKDLRDGSISEQYGYRTTKISNKSVKPTSVCCAEWLRKKKPPQVNQDIEESKDKPYDPELTPWNPPKRETVHDDE